MTDRPRTTPTHSAAWHYAEAERYLSQASFMTNDPGVAGLPNCRLVNPPLQQHLVRMAQAHAALAQAGAVVLIAGGHSKERAELLEHAEGRGKR